MEKNKMMVFENEQFGKVRSTLLNGEPWFVANDVCSILEIANANHAVKSLDADEKSGVVISDPHGRAQKTNCISESGLYSLILRSRKPEAKAFRRWITHEVIPSIRKHGAYMTDAVIEHLDENPELVSEYLHRLHDQNESARELRQRLDASLAENAILLPKAGYYDSFVGVDDLTCFRYTAKELGVPQKKLMGYLFEHNYLFRDRHRKGRAFAKAGKRNDPLFSTRDFYTPGAEKSEYTLVTPAGKEHLRGLVAEINAWIPAEKHREVSDGEIETNAAVFAK